MIRGRFIFYICIFSCLSMIFSSCSTKKKTWFSRQYHNTTARYNGYFNGNESIKYGVKKINDSFEDDYSTVLPVFKTGNLKKAKSTQPYMDKAIQKGSVVIQKHSINIRGKEYCKWIDDNYFMIGKAYFYKGEFDEAVKTFSFIIEEYKKSLISYKATLWLSRCFIEKQDYVSAEAILIDLENNRLFPKELKKDYEIINADLNLRQKNYPLAKESLLNCLKKHKLRKEKARVNFIVAQIYQLEEQFKKAAKHYTEVLKSNTDYSMVFNTKMNLALCADKSSKDSEKMRKQLVKMTKDDKNIEYLDQIYYTIAEMDILREDTALAKENYLNSTLYSVSNDPQKALSFLSLAQIEFFSSNFIKSQLYYDSTIFFMDEDYRLYPSAYKQYVILTDLVTNLNSIHLQDSLIQLALLPRAELNAVIKKIIDKEIEKENLEREKEILKRKNLSEGNVFGNRNEQFGNNTSGGKWYFYNPATLSFGLSEFTKKWGKRKLEDDWRRKNKKSTKITTEDSSSTTKSGSQNTKDPKFYLDQIPSTSEDFISAREKIANACYQAAIIYKYDLLKIDKSNEMLNKIFTIVDVDTAFIPMAYYNLYLNYSEQNKITQAESTKNILLSEHPHSVFSKIILDPEYLSSLENSNNNEEAVYEGVYLTFIDQNHSQTLQTTDSLKENTIKEKYLFLRAISFLKEGDTTSCINILAELKRASDKQLASYSTEVLNTIKDPTRLNESNREAIEKTPYIYNENSQHMLMFILPRKEVDISFLQTLISDYNTSSYSTEIFEINAMMIGMDNHLLTVRFFENAGSAMNYYYDIPYSKMIIKELKKTDYYILPISMDNFQEFYVNKDISGYKTFFNKKYLEEK